MAIEPVDRPPTVRWSARARRDLESIRAYIGEQAPLAAQRFSLRLVNAAESLAVLPDRGRPVRGGLRELAVIYPYIIRYIVRLDEVRIIRIKHGAQRPDA